MKTNILVISGLSATRIAVIARRTNSELMAGAKAMQIKHLKDKMRNGVAHFIFMKNDGTIREAWGTLNKSLIETKVNGRGVSREYYSTTAYFDIEKGAWRSFRWESIIDILN
jgi:hypothetical protein